MLLLSWHKIYWLCKQPANSGLWIWLFPRLPWTTRSFCLFAFSLHSEFSLRSSSLITRTEASCRTSPMSAQQGKILGFQTIKVLCSVDKLWIKFLAAQGCGVAWVSTCIVIYNKVAAFIYVFINFWYHSISFSCLFFFITVSQWFHLYFWVENAVSLWRECQNSTRRIVAWSTWRSRLSKSVLRKGAIFWTLKAR